MARSIDVSQNNVPAMLPLSNVQDPAVRDALQAIQTMLVQRSGEMDPSDPQKWVTREDLQAESLNTVARAFGMGAIGVTGHGGGSIDKAIEDLQKYFKESLAYQILGESFADIDISALQRRIEQTLAKVGQLQDRAFSAIAEEEKRRAEQDKHITDTTDRLLSELNADVGASFIREEQARATAIEAATTQLTAAISKLSADTQAAIISEAKTRVTADEAITSQTNLAISQLDKNTKALILAESNTRVTQDLAITTQFNAAVAQLDADTKASITSEATARATADEVLTNEYKAAVSKLGTDTKALITSETTTRVAADEAMTRKFNLDLASLGTDTKALITAETNARVTADEAVTSAANTAISKVRADLTASITSEATTRATKDEAMTTQFNAALAQLDTNTKALISSESSARVTAVSAATDQFNAAISQLRSDASAATVSEASTRVTQDQALAKAINTIWANMGGSQAVIQDGALANAGTNAVQATKWSQVQAAVTDPNTGQISSTSIRQELNSYASRNDGSLNSIYSVRAQVATNGRTVVGGIAVAATNGAGSSQGPTIDVGVRADKFFIAATADTPDGAVQLATDNSMPFMVLTKYEYIYGKLYAPGVYLKRAVIGEATIGSAQIADWFESDATNNYGQRVFRLNMRNGQMEFNPPTYGSDGVRINNEGVTVLSGGDWVVKIGNL